MILTKPTVYALRALSLLSRDFHGRVVKSRYLATRMNIHEAYLSRILSQLARKGIVTSQRGPSGGFRFAADPASVTLGDVLRSFDDTEALEKGCVMGPGACSEANHCCWHDSWSRFRSDALKVLETVTLKDLSRKTLEERFSNHQSESNRATCLALHEIT